MNCSSLFLIIILLQSSIFSINLVIEKDRPRIFLRESSWNGPSVAEIALRLNRSDYQSRISSLRNDGVGEALYYLLTKDSVAGANSLAYLKTLTISGSSSSYAGISAERYGAVYDWLRDHKDFDEPSRAICVAHMEVWADSFMHELQQGIMPFYSRASGALAGLTVLGLSLYGDSPKAQSYIDFAENYLQNKLGTIREKEDGATGGGSYGYHHVFTDYANLIAAWRSATDWDAAQWIKDNQGNWLERQMEFQMWTTYPNGWFVKHGDIWTGSFRDNNQFRMQIDAVSGMYRNSAGRGWAADMFRRMNTSDYWYEFLWEYFLFNDPDIAETPLTNLSKTAVFSDSLHRYVIMRKGWGAKDAVVHFICGETVDHHSTHDQGKFLIFKETPLAIKNGMYDSYGSAMHLYYQSPWSANCVVLNKSNFYGYQPSLEVSNVSDWTEWSNYRDRISRQPTGIILEKEFTSSYARVKANLSGAWPPTTEWIRELIFLDYKYLIVIDKVKVRNGYTHRWLLHSVKPPIVSGNTSVISNGAGRLFCRTLLPANCRISVLNSQKLPYYHLNNKGAETILSNTSFLPTVNLPERQLGSGRLEIMPSDSSVLCTYLNVLYPADTSVKEMPSCSLSYYSDHYTVYVDGLSYNINDSIVNIEAIKKEIDEQILKIGPNPFSRKVIFDVYSRDNAPVDVRIFSLNGKIVHHRYLKFDVGGHSKRETWDTKDLASGIYFLKATVGKRSLTRKLVLE